MQNDAEIKVLFIGLDGAGKTSIITKLKEIKTGELVEIYPTAFINCSRNSSSSLMIFTTSSNNFKSCKS